MKKLTFIIIIFLILVFLYNLNGSKEVRKTVKKEEKKAIFISYIELQNYVKSDSVEKSKKNIDEMINNIYNTDFNMIILQVRSFSDSIYESKIFPWSRVVSTEEGISPGFDILSYFIEKSHSKNIELHAWVNPYRIRLDNDISKITSKNPAYKWLDTNNVKVTDKGIYYNPASDEVIDLIVKGIEEITDNYDVDGIHFDDYFYTCDDIDIENYNEYHKTHNISLKDYRLKVVNQLIYRVHTITKKHNIVFSISPEGNIDNNYNKNYADIYTWASSNDYVDYLMPQLYYGFYNETRPFYKTIKEWDSLVAKSNVKIIPVLSLYKSGQKDLYAKSGENEWIENDNILMRQIIASRNINSYDGFSIFRYDYMYNPEGKSETVLNEVKNIKKIIHNKKV